ncbi:hypothetical protein AJ87_34550 [Rhizobium yanglingense]|nr:hypothetical protein AJ87_34550 [Rhizobium yanglingense]
MRLFDRLTLDTAESEDLGDAAGLDRLAVGMQNLDRLVGLIEPELMRPVMIRPRKGLASRIVPIIVNGPS